MEKEETYEISSDLPQFKNRVGDTIGKSLNKAKGPIQNTFEKLGVRVTLKVGPFSLAVEPVQKENYNMNRTKEMGQEELSL